MFKHIFINRLKMLLRTKATIFWTLVFPIILATFFNLAFGNLAEEEKFEPFNIAVIQNENYENEANFKALVEALSADGEDKMFNVQYVENKEEADKLLDDNEIKGYLEVKDVLTLEENNNKEETSDELLNENNSKNNIKITVKENGATQTILKSIVDNYYQTYSMIGNIAEINPQSLNFNPMTDLDNNNFEDNSNKNMDYVVVYFYTLIGMTCLYGGFFGINAINEVEANLSKRAARTSVAPTHKLKTLVASLLAGFIIQYAEVLILLAYLIFALGVDFGNQTLYIILLTLFGSLAGTTTGMLIGACNKKSENAKVGILISFTMTCSFLAGMMILDMKYIIAKNVPILAKINPVSMITDGLYSLYYYDTLERYFFNIISLIIFSAVMVFASYFFIRRKKYDNI